MQKPFLRRPSGFRKAPAYNARFEGERALGAMTRAKGSDTTFAEAPLKASAEAFSPLAKAQMAGRGRVSPR
jgi:hypothetical protein